MSSGTISSPITSRSARSTRRCSACSRRSARSACSRTAIRIPARGATCSPASTRTRNSTAWISARSRSVSDRTRCRKRSPRSGYGTACRSCANNGSWFETSVALVPVPAGRDRQRHHGNPLFEKLPRLLAGRHAADVSLRDFLVMDTSRLGGKTLSHVVGVEQDVVDDFVQVARPCCRRDGRLRVLPRRLGIRPADLRSEQLFDAGIAADRARQQAAGLLALEVVRRNEPALEAVAIRTNELEYDHVCFPSQIFYRAPGISARQCLVSRDEPGTVRPHPAQCRRSDPDRDNDERRNAAHGTSARHPLLRPRSALLQNRTRDHPDRKDDPQRDQYQIVQISQDRDEVGDEVDGAQRIGYDSRDQKLRVPGRAGMARSEPERESLALEVLRALFEAGE